MFSIMAKLFGFSKKQVKICVVGLDNSGKSTIINQLKPAKSHVHEINPTVGYSEEGFAKDNLAFTVFDMSGQAKYRSLWEKYYHDIDAVVFVVDCTDRIRMAVALDELQIMLKNEDFARNGCPMLFFANKMDLPGAMTPVDTMQELHLDEICDRPWHIT